METRVLGYLGRLILDEYMEQEWRQEFLASEVG